MVSKKFTLNKQEIYNVGKNAVIFMAPALIVLIASVQDILPKDTTNGVVILYALNILTDVLRKYTQGK